MPESSFTPEQIQEILNIYFENFAHRQYIGQRYVPIFGRKDEESIQWDNTGTYEPLTVVLYQGNSYTSRQFVPIGVEITNQTYWANTGNYNAQVEAYRQEVLGFSDRLDELEEKEEQDITDIGVQIGTLANSVNERIDSEEEEREAADTNLTQLINTETGARETADTNLRQLINSETNAREAADTNLTQLIGNETTAREALENLIIKNVMDYGAAADGVTNDASAFAAAANGGGIVFVPEGRYLVDSFNLVSHLKVIGYGAQIIVDRAGATSTTELAAFRFRSTASTDILEDVVIEGLEITGNIDIKSTAINLYQSPTLSSTVIRRITIKNCHIHNMGFRGVNIIGGASGGGTSGHGLPDVTLDGCRIESCGGHTICNSGTSIKVFNCYVRDSGSECISVDNGCNRVFIANSYFELARGGAGCISIDESANVCIDNCVFNQADNSRPAFTCNCSSGNVTNLIVNNCILIGGTYSLVIGGTNYYVQMIISNIEASNSVTDAINSRNSSNIVITSGNNWFRNLTSALKTELAPILYDTSTTNTII